LAGQQTEFGNVERLVADTVGPVGRRAFRIVVTRSDASAWLWVEKEQLQALAMLVEQLLTGLPALDLTASRPSAAETPTESSTSTRVLPPDIEFRVGQLALGYDEAEKRYMLIAHDVEAEDDTPRFTCTANRRQLRAFADSILPLLAASRPRCPACGQPLGDGVHTCPRANGHAAHAAIE
jgi:uncharacterized repeat protein (TIGR03847 family)